MSSGLTPGLFQNSAVFGDLEAELFAERLEQLQLGDLLAFDEHRAQTRLRLVVLELVLERAVERRLIDGAALEQDLSDLWSVVHATLRLVRLGRGFTGRGGLLDAVG